MIEMTETDRRAPEAAALSEKIVLPPTTNIGIQERFFALQYLAARVKELLGIAPTPPKSCHCRSTWEDFSMARVYAFSLAEIQKDADALLTKLGAYKKGRKDGEADAPEAVIVALKDIERRARCVLIGAQP